MQEKTLNYFYNYYIKEFFLELIAPAHCVVCGKKLFNRFVCDNCAAKIKFKEYPLIFHEEMVYYYGMTDYSGVIKTLITKFKFENYRVLSKFFSNLILKFLETQKISFDTIAFVPMTHKELIERGYNQTYLIAKEISSVTGKPILTRLSKIRETERQTKLSKKEREINIKNAFYLQEEVNKDILVIDDVYTTGSTAKEICKTLKKNNKNNKIYFLAIAQASE